MTSVVICESADIPAAPLAAIRAMLDAAYVGRFSHDDWVHGLGGTHAMILESGRVLAHASVVARRIIVGSHDFRAGYVEGVGVAPARHGQGLGSSVMTAINGVIRNQFELGVLSTGEWHFYERLGWERWLGTSWTLQSDGRLRRTESEDDGIMAYRVHQPNHVDVTSSITCEDRVGDCW
ncbi:MAG: GNAT family N-acetyltransferase [Actinobacteria bacterium]|nr:GNAT family N-acetyltransferase [Actinomycetota bacterium]